MSQDTQTTFTILRFYASGPQGGTKKTLVPGDRTLDLPAIAVQLLMEPTFHLASIFCGRPLSTSTAFVQRDHRRANSKPLAAKLVVMLTVVGRICQEAVKVNVLSRQNHCLGKLWRIITGALRGDRRDKQVTESVANHCQLRPVLATETFVATTLNIIGTDVSAFQTSRVDSCFGPGFNQAAFASAVDNSPKQFMESPFFRRRCSA